MLLDNSQLQTLFQYKNGVLYQMGSTHRGWVWRRTSHRKNINTLITAQWLYRFCPEPNQFGSNFSGSSKYSGQRCVQYCNGWVIQKKIVFKRHKISFNMHAQKGLNSSKSLDLLNIVDTKIKRRTFLPFSMLACGVQTAPTTTYAVYHHFQY